MERSPNARKCDFSHDFFLRTYSEAMKECQGGIFAKYNPIAILYLS